MMGALRLLSVILAIWLWAGPVHAEKRVALVIGNSAYKNVARLKNPANDAAAVAAMFRSAGFDLVDSRSDLSIVEMRKALREFGNRTRDADMAVIYYAGHGIELDGTNYLIPVDATLETDTDVYDETFPLDRVLVAAEPARQLRLIILDACRDNPFARTMKRTIGTRAIGRGLAKVEPSNPNTMIAFAAKAGSTAFDGDSGNSPFAAALVEYLPRPGLDLRRAFGFVRDDVLKATNNTQEPFIYGSLGGNDVPLVPARPVEATGPQADPEASVRKDYELALQADDRDAWEAFLRRHADGFYADLANVQLKKIAAEEARAAAAEKARFAEQEKIRLAAEGAKQAEVAKAAAAAKAAEDARIAAEKVRLAEQEKAAAAERTRIAEQEKARLADQDKAAADKAAAAERQRVAALPPSADNPDKPTQTDVLRALQGELRRVGCDTGADDGNWNATSQKALDLFNRHAGTKLDVKAASADALDAVKARTSRICPLVCDAGYRADGDRCMKIEARKPTAKRDEPRRKREPSERVTADAPPRPQASGQVLCNQQGCRPVRSGCRIENRGGMAGTSLGAANGTSSSVEVCH